MKIDLPHLNCDRDRHGKPRIFVRIGKGRRIRIRAPQGTPEFLAEYSDAIATLQGGCAAEKPRRIGQGTLGWLVGRYVRSPEFRALAADSQRRKRSILQACLAVPRAPGAPETMVDCPLEKFTSARVKQVRDDAAERPGAANNRRRVLSAMFSWAIEEGLSQTNPVRDVKRVRYVSDGFTTWDTAQIGTFLKTHGPGTTARRAAFLLLATGARRGDAVTLGRQHIHDGRIRWIPQKTSHLKREPVEAVIPQFLKEEIDHMPAGQMAFILNAYGKPFSKAGFTERVRKWCLEAGLPPLTPHGLRKAMATIAADNGATTKQLMAMLGHATEKEVEVYTRRADRRRLAADGAAKIKWVWENEE